MSQTANPSDNQQDFELPSLREDLKLYRGPDALDGSPTWNIFDPIRNKYFRIGWAAFQLLSRWGMGNANKILDKINNETVCNISHENIKELTEFLYKNSLTVNSAGGSSNDFMEQLEATKSHWFIHILKNALFIRIPLVRPDGFLKQTLPYVQLIFGKVFLILVAAWGLVGLFLLTRQLDEFASTFLYFFSPEGAAMYILALVFIKVLHEFGHAYVAAGYGCRIPTMGVVILVMFPVLYTDTSDSWKLVSKRQRILIGSAGMMTELYIAFLSTFLWSFLPDGILRSIAFIFATTSWTMSILVNTNIFMRFDGYYILSDFLEVENLQSRSFNFGKWRLRKILFNLDLPMPERMDPVLAWKLTLYAWGVWIYRLFLFIGIALLVYYFFFKLLGLLLFIIEIVWFIFVPIKNEIKVWWDMREKIRESKRYYVIIGVLLFCMIGLIVPLNTTISVPAILQTSIETSVHTSYPGKIKSIHFEIGEKVTRNNVLLVLEAPTLDNEIKKTISELNYVAVRLNRRVASPEDLASGGVLTENLQELQSKLDGLRALQENLTIKAPISGKIVARASNLHIGRWVNEDLRLASVIDPGKPEFTAIIRAENLRRIEINQDAVFLPNEPQLDEIPAHIIEIEDTNIQDFDDLYLASNYGGSVAVREDSSGRLIPENSSYRVKLIPKEELGQLDKVVVGNMLIEGKAESLLRYFYETVASVLIRESVF
jgi:putative peptide zinc metalloprotease protein